jgi:hypothetical protein
MVPVFFNGLLGTGGPIMKTRWLLLTLCAWLGALGNWVAAAQPAESAKPVAVLSVSSYDNLLSGVELLGKFINHPNLADRAELVLKVFAQDQGLVGLDKTRPWGAVAQSDGTSLTSYVYLPVTDVRKLLVVLSPYLGQVKSLGNDFFEVNVMDQLPGYVRAVSGWAFFSNNLQHLISLPADPSALLAGLHGQYDAAVRVYPANLPEGQRQQLVEVLRTLSARDALPRPGLSESQRLARANLSDQIARAVIALISDVDEATLGWKLDRQNENTYLDFTLTAKEGTELARQLDALKNTRSNFGGFLLPGAALGGNWSLRLPETETAGWKSVLELARDETVAQFAQQSKSDQQTIAAMQFVDDVMDMLAQTVAAGRIDGGAAVLVQPNALTVLAGECLADGNQIDNVLRVINDTYWKSNPLSPQRVIFNVDAHQGFRFHQILMPIANNTAVGKRLIELMGQPIEITIGVGADRMYLAAGRNAIPALKEVIERSATQSPNIVEPLHVTLALAPLAEFYSSAGDPAFRAVADRVLAELAKNPGSDHVKLGVEPIARGFRGRLEVESGILKTFARMVVLALVGEESK